MLKRRFHAHAPGIALDLSAPGALIADKQPRLLTPLVPYETDEQLQRLFLPHLSLAIPAIARLEDDVFKALPRFFRFAVEITPTRMFCTDAQQIGPTTRGTELDQS